MAAPLCTRWPAPRRVRGGAAGGLALLLALVAIQGPGADAYYEREVFIQRNFSCLVGDQRAVGWPVDLCDGKYDVAKVAGVVENFAALFDGEFEYGQQYTLMQLNDCAPQASPFYCATNFYFPKWGHTLSDNKWPHSDFDGGMPDSDEDNTVTVNVGMGCAVTCACCGARCQNVKMISSFPDLGEPTVIPPAFGAPGQTLGTETRMKPGGVGASQGQARPLLMYLHGYRGDANHASAKYYLQQLTEDHDYLVIAPNGRYDDLGFAHWLGTDYFTGMFLNYMDSDGNKVESDDPFMQHSAWNEDQYDVISENNIDIGYLKKVLQYTFNNFEIDMTRVYVIGENMGADMALQLACNMSHMFTAVISHDGVGYTKNYDTYCHPSNPVHILHIQSDLTFRHEGLTDGGALDYNQSNPAPTPERGSKLKRYGIDEMYRDSIVEFWAKANGCTDTSANYENLVRSIQILYDGSAGMGLGVEYVDASGNPAPDTAVYELNEGCAADGSVTLWRTRADRGAVMHPRLWTENLHVWLDTHRKTEVLAKPTVDSLLIGAASIWQGKFELGPWFLLVQLPALLMPFLLVVAGVVMSVRWVRITGIRLGYEPVQQEEYGTFSSLEKALAETELEEARL